MRTHTFESFNNRCNTILRFSLSLSLSLSILKNLDMKLYKNFIYSSVTELSYISPFMKNVYWINKKKKLFKIKKLINLLFKHYLI